MNYQKIHDNLVTLCRTNLPKDRLFKRNPQDIRLLNNLPLYVEIHHILPRSLGGTDKEYNLVEVLPEEHIFIHMLRYKIFEQREDMLAIRCMLNGIASHGRFQGDARKALTKHLRMGYAWMRSHVQNFRKKSGWQTEDGRNRISRARKGTMPVKDMKTGQIIGAVSITHPKVLSGEWGHHSKGVPHTEEQIKAQSLANRGQNNGNASGLLDEYFIEKGAEMAKEFGTILSWGKMRQLSESRGFPWIKSFKSRFNRLGLKEYIRLVEQKTGMKYNPNFFKTKEKQNTILC